MGGLSALAGALNAGLQCSVVESASRRPPARRACAPHPTPAASHPLHIAALARCGAGASCGTWCNHPEYNYWDLGNQSACVKWCRESGEQWAWARICSLPSCRLFGAAIDVDHVEGTNLAQGSSLLIRDASISGGSVVGATVGGVTLADLGTTITGRPLIAGTFTAGTLAAGAVPPGGPSLPLDLAGLGFTVEEFFDGWFHIGCAALCAAWPAAPRSSGSS